MQAPSDRAAWCHGTMLGAAKSPLSRQGCLGCTMALSPSRAFLIRIRAKPGYQIAAVAVARKVAALCWQLLTREEDYHPARCAPLRGHPRILMRIIFLSFLLMTWMCNESWSIREEWPW